MMTLMKLYDIWRFGPLVGYFYSGARRFGYQCFKPLTHTGMSQPCAGVLCKQKECSNYGSTAQLGGGFYFFNDISEDFLLHVCGSILLCKFLSFFSLSQETICWCKPCNKAQKHFKHIVYHCWDFLKLFGEKLGIEVGRRSLGTLSYQVFYLFTL